MRWLLLSLALFATALRGQGNSANELITKAARLGDLRSVESLLSAGVDPNVSDQDGRRPLYYAASFNHNEVAALLLAHHADPNKWAGSRTPGSEFPQAPLQIAAYMGNLNLASLLVSAGADVNAQTQTGRTALQFAVVGSHLDLIRFLIEKGADLSERDAEGTSALDDAVWRGSLEATAILLAKGARLNEAETKTGATPINEAAYRGETQLIHYLLQFGPNLGIPDKRGYTPLENSIRMGNMDSAILLLDALAPGQKTPEFLKRMLSAAIKKDQSAVVGALIQHGVRVNDPLESGATPLDAAAAGGAANVARVLLAAGADPNRSGRDGASPLEDACLKGFYSVAELLLENRALVNQVNEGSGRTAYMRQPLLVEVT